MCIVSLVPKDSSHNVPTSSACDAHIRKQAASLRRSMHPPNNISLVTARAPTWPSASPSTDSRSIHQSMLRAARKPASSLHLPLNGGATLAAMTKVRTPSTRVIGTRRCQYSMLLSPAGLASKLEKQHQQQQASQLSIQILDATWFMPSPAGVEPRNPEREFVHGPRIPGAAGFWDVDRIASKHPELNLPHMMPSAQQFADECCEPTIRPLSKSASSDR